MTCAEARIAIDARLDGELGPDEGPALEAHLAACADCAREVEDRRAFSASLGGALRRALDGVEAPREERARLVERLAAASRRRAVLPARLAAAAVLAIAAGLVAWALLGGPSAEQLALAEKIRLSRSREVQIERLQDEAQADLAFARESLASLKADDPPALVLNVGVSNLARQLSSGPPPPAPDRGSQIQRVAIATTVNGAAVELVQTGDGRVKVTLPHRTLDAPSMTELQRRHPDVCAKWSIEGNEGKVRVGKEAAVVELPARLDLLFRTGAWDDEVPWDAYRDWMQGRFNPAEMERRMKEMQERWRRAAESATVPVVTVDLEDVMKDVRGIGRQEADEAVKRVEEHMKALERRLKEMRELRGRAKGLRVYAEGVKKPE